MIDQLERQTEVLYDIASKYKKRAEEEQRNMLIKIKHLERQKHELLIMQKNEQLINQRVQQKIFAMKQLGFYMNPYIAMVDPMYVPQIAQNMHLMNPNPPPKKEDSESEEDSDDDEEEEEKPKKK